MVRAALITPAYLSIAWTLMISYQLFTQTAVTTVINSIKTVLPDIGIMLEARIDMVVFVYAFAWVFVLSSAIPSVILGKGRSVLVQFVVCLVLTMSAFLVLDSLTFAYGFDFTDPTVLTNPLSSYLGWFTNPIIAVFYLSLPYVFMLTMDHRARKKKKAESKRLSILTDNYIQGNISKDTQSEEEPDE